MQEIWFQCDGEAGSAARFRLLPGHEPDLKAVSSRLGFTADLPIDLQEADGIFSSFAVAGHSAVHISVDTLRQLTGKSGSQDQPFIVRCSSTAGNTGVGHYSLSAPDKAQLNAFYQKAKVKETSSRHAARLEADTAPLTGARQGPHSSLPLRPIFDPMLLGRDTDFQQFPMFTRPLVGHGLPAQDFFGLNHGTLPSSSGLPLNGNASQQLMQAPLSEAGPSRHSGMAVDGSGMPQVDMTAPLDSPAIPPPEEPARKSRKRAAGGTAGGGPGPPPTSGGSNNAAVASSGGPEDDGTRATKKTSERWVDGDVQLLIAAWKPRVADLRAQTDPLKQSKIWREVAADFHASQPAVKWGVKNCRDKLKKLRATFRSERHKQLADPSAPPSAWTFYEEFCNLYDAVGGVGGRAQDGDGLPNMGDLRGMVGLKGEQSYVALRDGVHVSAADAHALAHSMLTHVGM